MAAEDDGESGDKSAGAERKSRTRRQRPPVTIDLTAERVAADTAETAKEATEAAKPAVAEPDQHAAPPAAEQTEPAAAPEVAVPEAAAPEPPRSTWLPGASIIGSDDSWTRPALAGVAGGIVALILIIVLQAIGLVPSPGRSAALQAADQAKAANEAAEALDRRVSAVEMITQNLPSKTTVEGLDGKVAQLQKQMGGLATQGDLTVLENKLAALARKVDGLPAGVTQDDLAALADRVARLEAGGAAGDGGSVGSAAVAALNSRIDRAQASLKALDDRIAGLEAKASSGAADGTLAARAIAVVALRRAVDEGAPFATDLDLAAALGLPADDVAALKPFADNGVATKAALAAQFGEVGEAIVRAAAQADADAGFFDRLIAGMGSLVTVRPAGPVAGDDPAAIVSRMRAAVDAGDLEAALRERNSLPGAGRDASADWTAAAWERVTVDGLIARIADSVKPGNGPT
jgi:hypothetical protein